MLKYYQKLIESNKINFDPAQEKVAIRLEKLAVELAAYVKPKRLLGKKAPQPVGVYIYGKVGRGKSMLMDAFYNTLSTRMKRRVHFHQFMQKVHAKLHEARKTGREGIVEKVAKELAKGVKILCFDEYEVNDVTDAMILSKLFRTMSEAGVVFVITSNKLPQDHYKQGLQRQSYVEFCKFLATVVENVSLDSEHDYRLMQEAAGDNFFIPTGFEATQAMKERLKTMSAQHLDNISLEVMGRKIAMRAAGRIGWAAFDELCGQPLGNADYLKIAESFEVLFIENIPQMNEDMRNEARRFINLVDILYDAKTKLVASMDAEPENLYGNATTASFEFNRTVSRLREMRGW